MPATKIKDGCARAKTDAMTFHPGDSIARLQRVEVCVIAMLQVLQNQLVDDHDVRSNRPFSICSRNAKLGSLGCNGGASETKHAFDLIPAIGAESQKPEHPQIGAAPKLRDSATFRAHV
jgi:hypothetical protein